jgi:hypothetical protein
LAEIREKEARLLGQVREKLMPTSFAPPEGWEIEGIFLPGKRGGGDFMDLVAVAGRRYLMAGTAEGAGTAAGMVMVLGRTHLHEWLLTGNGAVGLRRAPSSPDPPPRRHQLTYHGVLASAARMRGRVVPQPEAGEQEEAGTEVAVQRPGKPSNRRRRARYRTWADRFRRMFVQ